jgi:C4-dicarboxylate transporter
VAGEVKIYQMIKRQSAKIYVATLILYILRIFNLRYFPEFQLIGYALGMVAIFFLIVSLPQMKGFMRLLIIFMLGSGTIMFFSSGNGFLQYLIGLQGMVNIICIFMIIELVGFPVAITNLKPIFRPIVKSAKSAESFYGILTLICMILGSIINMAVIPLAYHCMWDSLEEKGMNIPRSMGVALKRGLALSLFWSPFGIMMAIILEYSGVLWLEIALVTFIISLLALLVSMATEHFLFKKALAAKERKTAVPQSDHYREAVATAEPEDFWKTFRILVAYVSFLIGFVLIVNTYTFLGMVDTLILSSVTIPFFWSMLRGQQIQIRKMVSEHFRLKVPGLGEPFSLFIAAGVFATGLRSFGFDVLLSRFLGFAFQNIGSVGIVMMIVCFIMLTSWAGLHPTVTLVLIGQNLNFNAGIMPPAYYAIGMIIGGSLSNLTSPIAAVTLVTAGMFNKSPIEVGIKWNMLFVVTFLAVLPLILYFFTFTIT